MERPDYKVINNGRKKRFLLIKSNQKMLISAKNYYETRPTEFINDWCVTYDPRNAGTSIPTLMPFCLFDRQKEFIAFLYECFTDQENGAIEKCRDVGATWVACSFSIWCWLFKSGSSIGWGSRKEQLVHKLGDPDSIFEKMNIIIYNLPSFFKPNGFIERDHVTYMRIINPENNATITGEAGDNIGRGGRKSLYFKDEAQPLNSKILTPTGWVFMGKLNIGDYVIGLDGEQTKITQIKNFESRDVYEIEFTDGSKTECSGNHLWNVEKINGSNKKFIFKTEELINKYIYNSPGGQIQYIYRIPFCKPVNFYSEEKLSLDPYLLGCMLGDGLIGDLNKISRIISANEEIFKSFRKLLPEGVILGAKGKYCYNIVDEFGRRGWKYKSRARKLMFDSGISGLRSHTKFIPDKYKFSSINNRFSVLQGLMDTDGSSSDGTATFRTVSKKLSDDFIFIVQSLGGVAYHKLKLNSKGYDSMNVINISLPDAQIPFRLKRKIENLKPRKQRLSRAFKNIKFKRKDVVRCISVDNPNGLYLTDNFIVTHNSAHYEHPEKIEAALGDNTNVQIDISSVNGPASIFQRKIESGECWSPNLEIPTGITRIFIFDWRDHPLKDQDWYNRRKEKAEREGLTHLFAQEVDRDSTAAVEGTLIKPDWVKSAIDAHKKFDMDSSGMVMAAFDVADEGRDKHALAIRKGILLNFSEDWHNGDTGEATQKAVFHTTQYKASSFQYDSIGVGAGAKSETNRLTRNGALPSSLKILPWNAASSPLRANARVIPGDKQSPLNKDFYANLKAQGWWQLRLRFEKTYKVIVNGDSYPNDELISINSEIENLSQLVKELSQPTYSHNGSGKLVINKVPPGAKSPNRGDSVMMVYWPIVARKVLI